MKRPTDSISEPQPTQLRTKKGCVPSKEYRDAEAQEAKAKRRQRKEEDEKEAKVSNIILSSSLMGPFLFGKFISTSLQAVIEAEEKRQLPPLPYPCPTPEEPDIYRRYKIKRFEFFLANICYKLMLQV